MNGFILPAMSAFYKLRIVMFGLEKAFSNLIFNDVCALVEEKFCCFG